MESCSAKVLQDRKQLFDQLGIKTSLGIWLRPRENQVGLTESKLGGEFNWPPDVAWPVCDGRDLNFEDDLQQNDHYVAVAQFLRADFPEIQFPLESDILQILWCPKHHEDPDTDYGMLGPKVQAFWHRVADLRSFPNPQPAFASGWFLPRECSFHPMRVDDVGAREWTDDQRVVFDSFQDRIISQRAPATGEASEVLAKMGFPFRPLFGPAPAHFPNPELWRDLQDRAFKESLAYQAKWMEQRKVSKQPRDVSEAIADLDLLQIPGSKLLGFPEWNGGDYPTCDCGRKMPHLLTLHYHEVDASSEWYWMYDRSFQEAQTYRSVSGLALTDGWVLFFYCTECDHRPVKSLMLNS